jgi:homoserine kinase type II
MPFLEPAQAELLAAEIAAQTEAAKAWPSLPSGPAHCDLFRDNVLFAGTPGQPAMGGFIDFYFAGCDTWLFDVAVSLNDWCVARESGKVIPELAQAWLAAYAAVRPFTDAEIQAWPLMLRAAALRFWLSRLYDFYLPRPAQTLKPHDPTHFERVLRARHQGDVPALPRAGGVR